MCEGKPQITDDMFNSMVAKAVREMKMQQQQQQQQLLISQQQQDEETKRQQTQGVLGDGQAVRDQVSDRPSTPGTSSAEFVSKDKEPVDILDKSVSMVSVITQ